MAILWHIGEIHVNAESANVNFYHLTKFSLYLSFIIHDIYTYS